MRILILLAIVVTLYFPATGWGHTLDVPEEVEAALDGSFSFEWKFTVGPGTAFLAAWSWLGGANVGGGLFADCFCLPEFCILEEGEVIVGVVEGVLIDPTLEGSVAIDMELCDEPSHHADVTILPFDITAVGAATGAAPVARLLSVSPNPFNPRTNIHFELLEPGEVTLRVHDVAGRIVRDLGSHTYPAGSHTEVWDGALDSGGFASSGVYLIRLTADRLTQARPVVLIK